jgi:AcrR family transcriptional regulator
MTRHEERLERRAERRSQLLEAAAVAIRRDGAAVSMQVIAAEGGVTKPILYKHFGDRHGLANALAERFAVDLEQALVGVLTTPSGPRDVLESTIDAYLAFVERDPHLYRFLVRQALEDTGGTSATMSGLIARIANQVAVVLGERLRAIGGDSGAAEPWAFGLVGMVHLAGDWWLERQSMPRATLVTYLTDLLWHGLSTLGAAPGAEASETTGDVVRSINRERAV